MQRSENVKPDQPRSCPLPHNVVPEPNLPPLTEPGNGAYILLCDAARPTDALQSQSRPTSLSRQGQTVNDVRKLLCCKSSFASDPKTASIRPDAIVNRLTIASTGTPSANWYRHK